MPGNRTPLSIKFMLKNLLKRNFIFFGFIVFFIFIYWLFIFVPPHTDEFVAYNSIACLNFENYDLAYMSTYSLSCKNLTYKFFDFEFYKSFPYIGNINALLYYPIYKIYPEVYSHYIYGTLFLIIFSLVTIKSLKVELKMVLLPLLYFPLAYNYIHDSGPIKMACLSFPLLIFLFNEISVNQSFNKKNLYQTIIISLIIILAIEEKVFYIYLAPGIFLGAYMFSQGYKNFKFNYSKKFINFKFTRNFLFNIFILIGLVSIGLIFILLFTQKYIPRFQMDVPLLAYLSGILDHLMAESFLTNFKYALTYMVSPLIYTRRVFPVPFDISSIYNIVSFLSFIPVVIIVLSFYRKNKKFFRRISVPFILTLIIFFITRSTDQPHHYVYLHLFVLFSLIIFASKNNYNYNISIIALIILTSVNIGLTSFFNKTDKFLSSAEVNKIIFIPEINTNDKKILNFSDWGGYFQASLYRQTNTNIVTMIAPLDNKKAKDLTNLMKKLNLKKFFNICSNCNKKTLKNYFPNSNNIKLIKNDEYKIWKIYEITY